MDTTRRNILLGLLLTPLATSIVGTDTSTIDVAKDEVPLPIQPINPDLNKIAPFKEIFNKCITRTIRPIHPDREDGQFDIAVYFDPYHPMLFYDETLISKKKRW